MKNRYYLHRGFTIKKRIDTKNYTAMIMKGKKIIKCIAGDIDSCGNENSISKAKKFIDVNFNIM